MELSKHIATLKHKKYSRSVNVLTIVHIYKIKMNVYHILAQYLTWWG